MTAKQLSEETGVSLRTIRKLAEEIDGVNVGGKTGWVFSNKAPKHLRDVLRERAEERKRRRANRGGVK